LTDSVSERSPLTR